MEATAKARFQRGSARKMNRILTLIRNKPVTKALAILDFLPKPTKMTIIKTLKSASANALLKVGKAKITQQDLIVKYAAADGGPLMKRFRAGPRGSASRILRRTYHIQITVATKENK
ncbi:MAG: 50S ribosomal protein L22 [Candidatus Latescibacteria bacterium]|nr:50S ribosomal protein L22 [Candidatus Latescibacterota bacterium]